MQSLFPPLPELADPFLSRLSSFPLWYAFGRCSDRALERRDAAQALQPLRRSLLEKLTPAAPTDQRINFAYQLD